MATLDLITQRTRVLPENMQQEVLDFVEFLFSKTTKAVEVQPQARRVAGLHSGQAMIADNFDDPLPDSYWLGQS
jgi:hypothetical protein